MYDLSVVSARPIISSKAHMIRMLHVIDRSCLSLLGDTRSPHDVADLRLTTCPVTLQE